MLIIIVEYGATSRPGIQAIGMSLQKEEEEMVSQNREMSSQIQDPQTRRSLDMWSMLKRELQKKTNMQQIQLLGESEMCSHKT